MPLDAIRLATSVPCVLNAPEIRRWPQRASRSSGLKSADLPPRKLLGADNMSYPGKSCPLRLGWLARMPLSMTATTMGCGPGGILFVPMAEGAEALLSSAPKCQGKSCAALVENAAMSNAAEKRRLRSTALQSRCQSLSIDNPVRGGVW